jgi:CRP-like cAMP-binding protein
MNTPGEPLPGQAVKGLDILRDPAAGPVILGMLGGTTWAKGMSGAQIHELVGYLELKRFAAGEEIFSEGASERWMGLIISGRVAIEKAGRGEHAFRQLAELKPSHVFGELALLEGCPRSAQALALDESIMAVLTKERFDDLCAANPALALSLTLNISAQISCRLRTTSQRLIEFL